MPIIAFVLILGAAVATAILYPPARILAIAVVVGLLVLVRIYFLTLGNDDGIDARQLAAEAVALDAVALEEARGLTYLRGRVTNADEEARLRSFRIDLKLFDCPDAEGPLTDCAVIAEDEGIARVDVPPGQTRAFESVHRFSDRPDVLGTVRWEIEITGAEASR
ncbi:MAG: hypothetical protein AAF565_21990 [Pseudomonadota bacterium]